MAISVPSLSTDHPRLAVRSIPPVPKANAVRALAEKLQGRGFAPDAAYALARAAVDPADVRRRLERPAPMRVPGAVLWIVEADVWTPTVVPYIVNYREAAGRYFPSDETALHASGPPPIRRPKGDAAGGPVLDLAVESRDHLVQAVRSSVNYLIEQNPLVDSIAEKGVMFPITLVATAVESGDGEGVIDLPATVDGSSRVASALDVLGLEVENVIGRYRNDPRALPAFVGRIRSIFNRSLDEIAESEIAHANALILPARIVVGFEQDATGNADFAKAVHNYVQLIHGDLPPKVWPDTAKVDAKADSVVAELERADLVTPNKALYLEGMLPPAVARKLKFPSKADERGLVITSTLSSPKSAFRTAIRAGVVQRSERRNVSKGVRAEICAELALRGVRGSLTPKEVSNARDALASVYTHASIWEQDLKPSGRSPAELLEGALAERRAGDEGPVTAELGALGGFWLVARRILREARWFKEEQFKDGRAPNSVLSSLMGSEWGLRVLARALSDGREGDTVWQVDADGNRIPSVEGGFLEADHAWLRGTVVPPEREEDAEVELPEDPPPLPEQILLERRKALEGAVAAVEQRHQELLDVSGGDGQPLVESRGLPSAAAEELRERLDRVGRSLIIYGDTWVKRSDASDGPVEGEITGGGAK